MSLSTESIVGLLAVVVAIPTAYIGLRHCFSSYTRRIVSVREARQVQDPEGMWIFLFLSSHLSRVWYSVVLTKAEAQVGGAPRTDQTNDISRLESSIKSLPLRPPAAPPKALIRGPGNVAYGPVGDSFYGIGHRGDSAAKQNGGRKTRLLYENWD